MHPPIVNVQLLASLKALTKSHFIYISDDKPQKVDTTYNLLR